MEWIKLQKYAEWKDLSPKTVRRMIKRGELEAEKFGRQWRIALINKDRLETSDAQAHQEPVKGVLIAVAMELQRFRNPFPTVWDIPYRPDPSNNLRWEQAHGTKKLKWQLPQELEYGWQFALQHLQNGLPNAFKALLEAKESYAGYCQRLGELEDRYREAAQMIIQNMPGKVGLNESHFFRSILHEVDRKAAAATAQEYPVTTSPDGVYASYDGVQLLQAPDEDTARAWINRHTEWRHDVGTAHKQGLTELRREMVIGASVFVKAIEEVELRGRVPGFCDKCPDRFKQKGDAMDG